MPWQAVGQAVAVFAATNTDDLLLLLIFLAEASATGVSRWRVVAGQYLGFLAILVIAVVGALAAGLLPRGLHPLLGLLPLTLGIRAGWLFIRNRNASTAPGNQRAASPAPANARADGQSRTKVASSTMPSRSSAPTLRRRFAADQPHLPGVPTIALFTLASGGDNVGAYVPIFTTSGVSTTAIYLVTFLACLGLWILAGELLTAHHAVRDFLSRWADAILPVVMVVIGLTILSRLILGAA